MLVKWGTYVVKSLNIVAVNILSMLRHSMLGMVLVKLNLEYKLGSPEHHRVASLVDGDPGSD